MDTARGSSRTIVRFAAIGVTVSIVVTAASFTDVASAFTIVRYPLLGAALFAIAWAGWSTGQLPNFNRTLWAYAPWWARLSWLAVIAADLAVFASISVIENVPADPRTQGVLETRGIGAVCAYVFLIAGLRVNVDQRLAGDKSPNRSATRE